MPQVFGETWETFKRIFFEVFTKGGGGADVKF